MGVSGRDGSEIQKLLFILSNVVAKSKATLGRIFFFLGYTTSAYGVYLSSAFYKVFTTFKN